MLLMSATGLAGPSEFNERVERNVRVLRSIEDCIEGFGETVEGSTIAYASYRPDPTSALITRATTGAMAITWRSRPVPAGSRAGDVDFVVMAGIYGQEPSGLSFRLSLNSIPRFDFATTTDDNWEVAGREGGQLRFIGVTRDKYGDVFGCLRITVPGTWVGQGETATFSLVGEKANHPAWFMVFEAQDVVGYHRELVQNEAYCDMTIQGGGAKSLVELLAPSSWPGRRLSLASGNDTIATGSFEPRDGGTHVQFTIEANRLAPPLKIMVDDEVLLQLDTLFAALSTTLIYPSKLVALAADPPSSSQWHVRYEATYHPDLGTSLQDLAKRTGGQGTQHLFISTHQDIAWMDSPENCIRDRDEKIITPLLEILRRDSTYHFDLEDVLCLREYLERHPERKQEIHRFMKEGRLGIGASFNQPYEDLCSGEMLVRQFLAGRRWLRTAFPGCDTKVYWNPDVPGRTQQMPQVMQKAGVKYLMMSRFRKGLFSWLSPDGSSVVAFSPGHYADFKARVEAAEFEQAAGFIAASACDWLEVTNSISPALPLVSMSDMSGPDRYDSLITKWRTLRSIINRDGSVTSFSLPPIRYSILQAYLDKIAPLQTSLPAIYGERPNIWLYIHGPTHHHAISAKREADVLLPAAEIFSTIDALLKGTFATYPQAALTEAWEAQLYPDHGWGGKNGEITDSLFRAKYESARDIAGDLLGRAVRSVAAHVNHQPTSGIRVVVFNALSWKRSGPVQASFDFDIGEAAKGIELFDVAGNAVPAQLDIKERHPDGSIASAGLLFIAEDVPPVGYATYYAQPGLTTPAPQSHGQEASVLESQHYRLLLGAGGVEQIVDKEFGEALLETNGFRGGELFTMQSVGEDAGEWSEPQQPTMEGFDRLASHPAPWRRVESGPVRDVIETRYGLAHVTIAQRVLLYKEIKRIDFEVSLLEWNGTPYREFRLAFPLRADQGHIAYEVPFGTLVVGVDEMKGAAGERYTQEVSRIRPRTIQRWIGLSGPRVGVTLSSSVAVWDYIDPTDSVGQRLLLQPVLLASRRSCHGEGPWYLQKGDHHYRFSLTSHAPGWHRGQRQGVEADAPLVAVVDAPEDAEARLPESGSFLSMDAENLVLSTLKKCEDDNGLIIRFYESAGTPTNGRLRLFMPIQKAETTDLLEDIGQTLPSDRSEIEVAVGAHEIYTVKVVPAW